MVGRDVKHRMNYIKLLHIEGFKKFVSLDVPFNEHMNILVGENEAGKSTILDALKTVLNQQYRTADKSVLRDLFNAQMVAEFRANPSVNTLPKIYIEVELVLDPQEKNASYFYGEVYGRRQQQTEKYGIRFECKYDEELGVGMEQSILEGKIPYEYYALTWTTFAIYLCMWVLSIVIFVIVYGRMIEIYLTVSVAPIPFSTMANREWGAMGTNYLRALFALGFQGFLILICIAIYAVLVQSIPTSGSIHGAIWGTAGYTVLLACALFKTGSLSKSIFNAH